MIKLEFYDVFNPYIQGCQFRKTPYVANSAEIFSIGDYTSGSGIRLLADDAYNRYIVQIDGNPGAIVGVGWGSGVYHLAVVGNGLIDGGRNIKLFLNGHLIGSYTYNYNLISTSFKIGGILSNIDSTNLYQIIDEFRVSNIARWTSDFTPPSAPYTLD